VALGSIAKLVGYLPATRPVVVVRDNDKPDSPADVALRKALDALVCEGHFVSVAAAPSPHKDANNLLRAEGIEAVAAMIATAVPWELSGRNDQENVVVCEPSWPLPTASLSEAQQAVEQVAGEFFTKAQADGSPCQIGVRVDMGVGKSAAVIRAGLDLLIRDRSVRLAIFLPGHAQAGDFLQRCNATAGLELARVWRGLEQPDPDVPEETMCRRTGAVDEVVKAGGAWDDVCGSRKRGHCPFHEKGGDQAICGYRHQILAARFGAERVWILPHAMLGRRPPKALKDFGLSAVVIDESPWLGMIHGCGEAVYAVTVDTLARIWDVPDYEGETRGWASERLNFLCRRVLDGIGDQEKGRLQPSNFRPRPGAPFAGLSAAASLEARGLVLRMKKDPGPEVVPGWNYDTAKPKMVPFQIWNGVLFRLARFFDLLAKTIEGDGELSPYLELFTEEEAKSEGVVKITSCRMYWRDEVDEFWASPPVLYLDGTMQPDLARCWLPRLDVRTDMSVQTPAAVTRRQVVDSAVAHGKVVPDDKASAKNQQTQRANLERLVRLFEVRAAAVANQGAETWDGLIIVPKDAEANLGQAENWPRRFALGHHNALRGVDAFKGVRYLAIVSRPLPPPIVVERIAWVAFGFVGQSLDVPWYPKAAVGRLMSDGTGRHAEAERHPDPEAEAVRWAICEAELLQLEARARAVRRDAGSPLLVDIVTATPLPLPVHSVMTWSDWLAQGAPVQLMVVRRCVPSDWKGVAQVLSDVFPSANAARNWFARNPFQARVFGTLHSNNAQTPIGNILCRRLGAIHADYALVTDGRKGARVLILAADNPRAIAERFFGPLRKWCPHRKNSSPTLDDITRWLGRGVRILFFKSRPVDMIGRRVSARATQAIDAA
jgi:putative DNA primase/helicase